MSPLLRRSWARRGQTPVFYQRTRSHKKVSAIAALCIAPDRKHLSLYFRLHPDKNINALAAKDFLRILSRRNDGFHEIHSLMQAVSLYDEISIELTGAPGVELLCTGPAMPEGADNIAHRAATLLLERTGLLSTTGVRIEIIKRIPAGAGLGGGSSDAATVLMAVNSMTDAGLDDEALMEIGSEIGSDVPFFILRSPAFATGRGEKLIPALLPELDYILINPGFELSTGWVYTNLDLTKRREGNILTVSVDSFKDAESIKDFLYNDLEDVSIDRYPEIAELKAMLRESGALGSLMSGSGPTVFGLYADRARAQTAFDLLSKTLEPARSIFLVRGLVANSG